MKVLATVLSLALMASPALAQNSVTNWSNANYDVTGSSPGEKPGCIMTSTFEIEGRSDVDFNLLWDGETALFALTSWDWSAVKGREYDGFVYYFPQSKTIYDNGTTLGYVHATINKGFVTMFGGDFLDKLAAENRLMVNRMPDGQDMVVVADLNLEGTAAAVAALRRCANYVNGREAARIRRESRNDYIARDPF